MSEAPKSLQGYPLRLVAILALINFVNFADRQVITPLFPLLRDHFSATDAQLGSLQFWLQVVLAVASIPLGLLADRVSRSKIIAAGVIFWSLATFLSGMAGTFNSLPDYACCGYRRCRALPASPPIARFTKKNCLISGIGRTGFIDRIPAIVTLLDRESRFVRVPGLYSPGSIEQPVPGPALTLFLNNLLRAVTMFAWDNGEIWPVSIPYHPALDVVSAALFYLGVILLLVRYVLQRNWLDLFLISSVPLLLMPSILSLAFPNENPALNRMADFSIIFDLSLLVSVLTWDRQPPPSLPP